MTARIGKYRVTSKQGWRVLRGVKQYHGGRDTVGEDKRIRAIFDTIKTEVRMGWNGGRGNLVILYYSDALRQLEQHLNEIYVKNGARVKQGDIIGLEGWSGDCVPKGPGGSHLHSETQRLINGRWQVVSEAEASRITGIPNAVGPYIGDDKLDTAVKEPEQPATPADPKPDVEISIGDIVPFTGGTHYTSSAGGSGFKVSSGDAKVTALAKGAKYPYHLVNVKGGTSTVYGWVAAKDISRQPLKPEPAPPVLSAFKVGDKVIFSTGYRSSTDTPDKALHVAKKQIATDRGIVGAVLDNGAQNPLKIVSAKDGDIPICWCNDGDIRGRW